MQIYDIEFFSGFAEVDKVVKEVIDVLKKEKIREFSKVEFRINFMLREVLNNAVEHGNRFDRTKKVRLTVCHDKGILLFTISDEGSGIEVNRHGINDFVLRERNRGYEVIKNFDFDVLLDGSVVKVTLNMRKVR